LAAKKIGAKWKIYVLMSDGELGEGSNWEAILFASHHKLDNLVVIIDSNNMQSLDTVENTLGLEPLAEKFKAFGWAVCDSDGHDHSALRSYLSSTPWSNEKPSILIARTTKGKGVSFMENTVEWHYRSPNDEQLSQAITEIEAVS